MIDPEAIQTVTVTVACTLIENIPTGKSISSNSQTIVVKYMNQVEIDELLISLRPVSDA